MSFWYWEQPSATGGWTPVTSSEKPELNEQKRIKRAAGVGPRVRGLTEVPEKLRGLSLDELAVALSPDREAHP